MQKQKQHSGPYGPGAPIFDGIARRCSAYAEAVKMVREAEAALLSGLLTVAKANAPNTDFDRGDTFQFQRELEDGSELTVTLEAVKVVIRVRGPEADLRYVFPRPDVATVTSYRKKSDVLAAAQAGGKASRGGGRRRKEDGDAQ